LVGFFEIQVQAQLGETSRQSTSMTSFQQLDRTVVDSVLKIVDDKFDSLSERISSLERAVNGLQYYNVRQFKVVNTNLNTVDKTLQFMNSQVGLMDVENKGLKISMDLVK
jgi:flagellar biosynthesis/type III secretory pathway chaperone